MGQGRESVVFRMKKISTIGFIGAGNMAQALISGLVCQRAFSSKVFAFDPDAQKLKKLKKQFQIFPLKNNYEVVEKSEIVLLAVKPQEIRNVLKEIAPALENKILISIAAGIDTNTLSHKVKAKVIRAMPNNPALIGQGITALFSKNTLSPQDRQRVENIFLGAGEILWVKRERDLDVVTGLSGSGPAYVYQFVEDLSFAGEKLGLAPEVAYPLALKTVVGAALTLEKTGKKPVELIPLVTSKKGTTLEGLKVLKKMGLRRILVNTVRAATRRAREMRSEK